MPLYPVKFKELCNHCQHEQINLTKTKDISFMNRLTKCGKYKLIDRTDFIRTNNADIIQNFI
jgi:hypothetical protein